MIEKQQKAKGQGNMKADCIETLERMRKHLENEKQHRMKNINDVEKMGKGFRDWKAQESGIVRGIEIADLILHGEIVRMKAEIERGGAE